MHALDVLRRLVELESPTREEELVDRAARVVAAELSAAGAAAEMHGRHVVAHAPGEDSELSPLLLLAHVDTVWPVGTLAAMPFSVRDGYAHGPGVLDMKAGIVTILSALHSCGRPRRPVTVLVTADEEIGSPTGRLLVEEHARGAAAALVLEPPVRDDTITTARSGLARYQLHVTGRAAHAGGGHTAGVSAVGELAHQTLVLHSLEDVERGVRVNVGQIGGGTGDNVVAAEAWARIDARAWTGADQRRLEHEIRGLQPHLEGATLTVTGAVTRPPMIRDERAAALAGQVLEIASEIGIPLAEHRSGGGSDGNFAAAAGAPVVDGLGPNGVGAHAVDERVSLRSLEQRAQLLSSLLMRL
ncbi:MAG TPA: M20 family metallopeptidase [Gaiellales bacterium]|nr:M20 family metallopeptidase [Gaiellales bacterium]